MSGLVGGNGPMGPAGHHGGGISRADRYASQNGRPGGGTGRGPSSDFDSMYTYSPLPLASSNTPDSPRSRGPNSVKYTQIPLDNMDGPKSGGMGYNSIRMHLYERPDYKYHHNHAKDIPHDRHHHHHPKEEEAYEDDEIPEDERAEEWKSVCYHFTQNTTFHGMNKITESTPFILRRWVCHLLLPVKKLSGQLAIKEVSRCSTRGGYQGLYIIFASATQIRQSTLALKPTGHVTRNPKQVHQFMCPAKT